MTGKQDFWTLRSVATLIKDGSNNNYIGLCYEDGEVGVRMVRVSRHYCAAPAAMI